MWKRLLVTGAAATAVAVPLGALPAYANAPPVQSGCTFDGSTGQTTCVTTTQPTPVTATITPGESLPFPGGVTIAQLCDSIEGTTLNYNLLGLSSDGSITYDATSTTTTSMVHQGVSPNGHQVSQSTMTSAMLNDVTYTGTVDCLVSHH
jgi:hypothetical protein